MCILCIASRCSRHIAAMVMPMVTLWALSQFLPQGFRFEINSPKLACVGMLFVSLSWCELVMPRLSAWRARRTAALKERRRVEAQEATKRRKKATRRCRNCFTAYKDQSPGSGRFMCTFCGHVSKRPVLDLPVGASSASTCFSLPESAVEFLNANGFFSVRSPKYWYDRASFVRPSWGSGKSWIGVRPWIDGANWGVSTSWFGGSWPGSALYFGNTGFGWPDSGTLLGDGVFGGERWFATDSYFGVFWFLLRIFSQLLVFAVWIWRKLSMAEVVDQNETDGVHEVCDTRNDVGGSSLETKGKKARRKAEEKRLARLEKECQEAEEKKQREEVARLVEERRRQRDTKLETEKESVRKTVATLGKGIEVQKEPKLREEMSRGKDKVHAKENFKNQDIEELTKKTSSVAVKILRPFKNTGVKDKEPSVKAASNFFSKWGAFKSRGSAKSGLLSQSRNAAVPIKASSSLLTDLNPSIKPCKAAVPNTSSFHSAASPSIKLIGTCTEASCSAWTQTAWTTVLSHGAMEGADDTLKKMSMVGSHDRQANTNSSSYASMDSINNLDVSNFMGGISQQQSRAAASSLSGPHDQSFADSLCSTSVDLPESAYTEQGLSKSGRKLHRPTPITTASEVCVNESSASVAVQYSMSNTSADMFEVSPSPSLSNISSPLSLNNPMGKHTCDSLYLVAPSDSLAVTAFGIETNPLLSLDIASLPSTDVLESVNANRRDPCQIWEPVNDLNGQMFHDKWHHRSLTYPSQINTLPLDASYQQRDDLSQQTIVEPEFYLPSSLFSFEEIDHHHECSCENRMPRQSKCLDLRGMESSCCGWEDMDVYHRVPPEFVDCITHSLMQDPVITSDGHSYERSAIEDWLRLHDTSPKTGEVLPPPPGGKGVDKTLRPNHILRCQIIEFRERVLQRLMNSARETAQEKTAAPARSDFFWPPEGNTTKPVLNNFYPAQGVESVWSHDVPGD